MSNVLRFPHSAAVKKRSGRKSATGIPVLLDTIGTNLLSIFRPPVSHRDTVGRETPSISASSSCDRSLSSRKAVKAESAIMGKSVPNRHSGCQGPSVGLTRDTGDDDAYCTDMVTKNGGYLWIKERMDALEMSDKDVADECGVYRETVTRWRTEQHRLNPAKMANIAKALKCSVPDLFVPPSQMTVVIEVPRPPDAQPIATPAPARRRIRQ